MSTLDTPAADAPALRALAQLLDTRVFVFGYGSLIHPYSRRRTLQQPKNTTEELGDCAVPCLVHGLARSWSYNCRNSYTALGVRRVRSTDRRSSASGPPAVCNGVLFPLHAPETDLAALDERERHYQRIRLRPNDIELLLHAAELGNLAQSHGETLERLDSHWRAGEAALELAAGELPKWRSPFASLDRATSAHIASRLAAHLAAPDVLCYVYEDAASTALPLRVPEQQSARFVRGNAHAPCAMVPLGQTYIDIVMEGCLLTLGVAFTHLFATTTAGWTGVWVDDRHWPAHAQKYRRTPCELRIYRRLWASGAAGSVRPWLIERLLQLSVQSFLSRRTAALLEGIPSDAGQVS